jgi:hypothetical protein
VESSNVPGALVKWFHGANMGIVLASMVTFGAFLGWQIRSVRDATCTPPVVNPRSEVLLLVGPLTLHAKQSNQ